MGSRLPEIIYEDNHLIAVNKRAGDLVQGDKTGDVPLPELLKSYIKNKFNKPGAVFLGVIHRLDRPTTGVVLFARTSKGLERMNAAFKNRETQKNYWALVEGQLSQGGELIFRAGAGIVSKSVPENEVQEVYNKLAALEKAMEMAQLNSKSR